MLKTAEPHSKECGFQFMDIKKMVKKKTQDMLTWILWILGLIGAMILIYGLMRILIK